jgi:hypothetical protein
MNMGRLLRVAAVLAAAVLVISSLPDIIRYVKMRQM